MYCGECGAKLKKGATFCGECGAKVKEQKEEKPEEEKKKVVKKRKPMAKKTKILLGVLVVVIVLYDVYNLSVQISIQPIHILIKYQSLNFISSRH